MPAPRDPSTLLAAARLYYRENRSQAEIASELGTSRSNVSRMLTEAQRQGIVTITINDPSGRMTSLEQDLRTRFGLAEVRVAQRGPASSVKVEDQVGIQAAQLLTDLVADSMTVALSWGHALQAMVYAVEAEREYHLKLTQLVGGLSSISNEISGAELVRELAGRLGADYVSLHAPATLASPAARAALVSEKSIGEALELAGSADLAFVGIGTPSHGSSAAILASLQLTPERGEGVLGCRAGRATSPPATTTPRAARCREPSPTGSSPSTWTTCAASPTSSGSRTDAPRRPVSSAPSAAT